MICFAGQSVDKFGKDNTGLVTYNFNQQGFRSKKNYDSVPEYAFFGFSNVFGIGIPEEQTFANMFENSHNYGLAGSYTNTDIFKIASNYAVLYPGVKKIVCWTDRDSELLPEYSKSLESMDFIQFFSGNKLPCKNCFNMLPNVDKDVSQTHMGIKSHQTMYKLLRVLVNRIV